MTEAQGAGHFREALIFLAMAGVIVPLFHRLRISPVIGFLIGGVALGPHGLVRLFEDQPLLRAITIADIGAVMPLAELGVVFLLFTIGLELSFERLKALRRLIFGLGSAQLLATTVLLALCGLLLGLSFGAATVLGAALALSSTAILIPVLAEKRRLASTAGRTSFAILILQDLAVAPILIAITAMAGASGVSPGLNFAKAFGFGVLIIAGMVVVGRLVLRPLMQIVARSGSQELFLAACLLVAMGAGLIASSAGYSMAIGAFVAGLLLAETEFRHEIEVTIGPFKGLLLGLFFMTAGAQLDLEALYRHAGTVAALTFGLLAVKAVLLLALLRAFRIGAAAHPEIALSLAPAGELGFVLIAAGVSTGIVAPDQAALTAVIVLITMFLVSPLHRLGLMLARRQSVRALPEEATLPPDRAANGKVIIVGFGRVGQVVADMLRRNQVPFIAVDVEPSVIANARKGGIEAVYGDASRGPFLTALGLEAARALVATSSDPDAVERLVRSARAARPDLTIIARARDASHASRLYALGATDVVPETVEASLQLAENVLIDIGTPMGLVIASIHERRDEFRAELQRSGQTPRPVRPGRRAPLRRDPPEKGTAEPDDTGR